VTGEYVCIWKITSRGKKNPKTSETFQVCFVYMVWMLRYEVNRLKRVV